jgi:hypothetical protein
MGPVAARYRGETPETALKIAGDGIALSLRAGGRERKGKSFPL